MQRSEHSFIKNGKERKDRNVLLKRTDAQPWCDQYHEHYYYFPYWYIYILPEEKVKSIICNVHNGK